MGLAVGRGRGGGVDCIALNGSVVVLFGAYGLGVIFVGCETRSII